MSGPRTVRQDVAVQAVACLAERRAGEALFVGVDGPGGAGKSSFAARVAAGVSRGVVVAVDDFSGPRIREWDWERCHEQLVAPLLAGRTARYQRWDWDRDEGAEWHDVVPGSVVVLEGVSSTRRELHVPWLLRIWVETPSAVRSARALERDGVAMMRQWTEVWIPSEQAYFAAQDPRGHADLVVGGAEGC